MEKDFRFRKTCRICDKHDFIKILDLGRTPLANYFLCKSDLNKIEKKFPLVLYFCKNCKLVQLCHVVEPSLLFDNYPYLTSASNPLAEHFEKSGKYLSKRFSLSKKDLVAEIGGNDGVLLDVFKRNSCVLNIEPALHIAAIARKKGIETLSDFFDKRLSKKIVNKYGQARLVLANNVIAHIDNLQDVFEGIKIMLAPEGVFVFEVHWVGNLIGKGGFDQIYHEHLSYFSLISLNNLIESLGLKIIDVELLPIHGQSMRVYVSKKGKSTPRVKDFLKMEKELGLNRVATYKRFSERVRRNKQKIKNFLASVKKEGKTIVGYGAPAKGNTLLNYYDLDYSTVDFIVDTTPLKQGKYTPGTHIPIHPPEMLQKVRPDYFLLLAWNYAEDILRKESDFRKCGGKFIVPVPKLKVI